MSEFVCEALLVGQHKKLFGPRERQPLNVSATFGIREMVNEETFVGFYCSIFLCCAHCLPTCRQLGTTALAHKSVVRLANPSRLTTLYLNVKPRLTVSYYSSRCTLRACVRVSNTDYNRNAHHTTAHVPVELSGEQSRTGYTHAGAGVPARRAVEGESFHVNVKNIVST
ncbi:hypothetical protein CBL_11307 [Carabus blaptoides fortunei]